MQEIVKPLLEWFQQNKRPLPWREDTLPYHVWVSEIMLQQTRIEAVMRYYARFMDALPDIASLSEVDDDALLKLWEGLGYYSRARNLKKAARTVMQEYDGVFPSRFEDIKRLSGIGEYTAGAIASICFNEKVPAVDGNVLRVIARVTGSRENVLLPAVKKQVASRLSDIMPDEAGAFNEALMELGELVCLPNGVPLCEKCPLHALCAAFRDGLTEVLPVRIKALRRGKTELCVFLIRDADGRIAIEKRGNSGLLAGMYQLPNVSGHISDKEIREQLTAWDVTPLVIAPLGEAKHAFTHIDWMMKGYRIEAAHKSDRFLWVSADDISVVDGDEEFKLRMSRYARRKREVLKDNLSVAVKQIDSILMPSKMWQASESERESLVALREVITSYIDGMDI